jgi:SAM-dependent methyltransferase
MQTSTRQGRLWGARARDWAEGCHEPLYNDVLERLPIGAGSRVLDAGCGAGRFCALAIARGARVVGIDAAEPLLVQARTHAPSADLRVCDLEALPFAAEEFDVVTGFNSFQYAGDPAAAVGEARRVVRSGGHVVIATWGRPEHCEAAAYFAALRPLVPAPPSGGGGPFALSDEAAFRSLATNAGLAPAGLRDVLCVFAYPDVETALRALLSAGPAVAAIETSGEATVRAALTRALEPFTSRTGAVRLENEFRYLVATRP